MLQFHMNIKILLVFAQAFPMQINKQGDTIVSFKSLYNGNIFNKLQLDMGKTAKARNY